MATKAPEAEEWKTDWWVNAQVETRRGWMTAGMFVGVGTVGASIGMMFPAPPLFRVVVSTVGGLVAWACLRGLRDTKDAQEAEQEEMRKLRRWYCMSERYRCKDPVPHLHRADDWDEQLDADNVGAGDKVYA